jgi:hypothetical protein
MKESRVACFTCPFADLCSAPKKHLIQTGWSLTAKATDCPLWKAIEEQRGDASKTLTTTP